MTNQTPPQDPNPIDMWRQYITDSERQWNGFFRDVLGTDTFSNSMNAWVEGTLTVQRMVADQLDRLYTTFNIPTHGDLVDLGERMKGLEESFMRLELLVEAGLSSARTAKTGKPARAARPSAPVRRAPSAPPPLRLPPRTRTAPDAALRHAGRRTGLKRGSDA